jgi:hypothetical protein
MKIRIVLVDNNFGQSEPMKSGYGINTCNVFGVLLGCIMMLV